MKKVFIFIPAIILCMFVNNLSYAIQVKSSDYKIVNDNTVLEEENTNYTVKKENDKLLFIERNNKLGIIDKASGNYILEPVADEIIPFKETNEIEYKIKINNNTGYLNTDRKVVFIANYDEMYLLDDYIKIKKDNKFGFFDKDGNLILKPIFDEVGIIKNSDNEYLTGKYKGEVNFFDKKGKYIPENELYTVKEENIPILVRDLKPIIKKFRRNNNTIYRTAKKGNDAPFEIEQIELKGGHQVASVEKNVEKIEKESFDNTVLSVKNKNYILVNNKGKMGLNKENGEEVIPALYKAIDIKKPCEHFSSPVVIAKKQNSYTLYDLKGKVLAEQVYDKINVYRYGKVYSYKFEGGKWILRENNKTIGNITINSDNTYEFEKIGFHIRSLHKINELLVMLLTIA